MKYLTVALLLALCQKSMAQEKIPLPIFETDTLALGDINRDGSVDYVYLTHPKWISTEEFYGDCNNGNCSINVRFSFTSASVSHDDSVNAWVQSIGDIDEDGTDEIVVATGWFIGCRGNRHFYTLKQGTWQLVGETYHFNCITEDEVFDPEVKKTGKGTFETPHLEFNEDEGDEITVMKRFTIK